MICRICEKYNFYRPRMYRQKARKDYLALVKCRKRGVKKIRKAIKKQLQYVRRDLGYKDSDSKAEKKLANKDNTDRIEVERKFSLAKRKFGLGMLLTKREDTTRSSITLSVIAMNIDRLAAMLLRLIVHLLECLSENRALGLPGEVWGLLRRDELKRSDEDKALRIEHLTELVLIGVVIS